MTDLKPMPYTPIFAPPLPQEPAEDATKEELNAFLKTLTDTFNPYWEALNELQARSTWQPLSDAEAAAEYWRAEMDRHSLGDGYDIEHWGGELRSGMESEKVAFPRFDAIQRFAYLPHAHEDVS